MVEQQGGCGVRGGSVWGEIREGVLCFGSVYITI